MAEKKNPKKATKTNAGEERFVTSGKSITVTKRPAKKGK